MGAEPVIVVRDERGQPQVFLNTCPHRGGQLCRADMGNTSHFRCSYHGWTFNNKGELRGVPEVYPSTFDRKSHALFGASRVETFAGLIFATFNPDAPSLEDYLGDAGWYLQAFLGKTPMEVVAPPTRGILRSNWKVGAENYAGDGYHVTTTHKTPIELGMFGNPNELAKLGPISTKQTAFCIDAGNGHTVRVQQLPIDFENPTFLGYPPELWGSFAERLDDAQLELACGLAVAHGNIFPNLSFLDSMVFPEPDAPPVALVHLRQWQPLGPDRTELTMWALVPKDASPDWKRDSQRGFVRSLGFGGIFEIDDFQNWIGMAETNRTNLSWDQELVYEAVPENGPIDTKWPGRVYAVDHSEVNQIAMHRRWSELMQQ
jgi:phenylpropionate dioxygenase-like ring-hydroxylating dioxygenase large terminal subunit